MIFLSCSSKKNQESDSIVESTGIGFDSAASHYPIHEIFNDHPNISDGEAEHSQTLSQEEMRYHSKRGVSTLEDAYLEGYEDGEEDSCEGKRHGHSYDHDSEFTGKFEESYNAGPDTTMDITTDIIPVLPKRMMRTMMTINLSLSHII